MPPDSPANLWNDYQTDGYAEMWKQILEQEARIRGLEDQMLEVIKYMGMMMERVGKEDA